MRNAQAMTSLYVRLEAALNTAMREAVRASPNRYRNVSGFVRTAIKNQLKHKGRNKEKDAASQDS